MWEASSVRAMRVAASPLGTAIFVLVGGAPASADDAATAGGTGLGSAILRVLPEHAFHPVVIHFPIALFVFGAFLDVLGWCRKQPRIRDAGFWNMFAGAASTFVVIPTGVAIFYKSDYTWHGPVLIHFWLALVATVSMAATVVYRRRGAHESRVYFALLVFATLAVSAAGHFGGQLIYGV